MGDHGDSDQMGSPPSTISLSAASERLGVHYMTAYRYIRTGRLPATKRSGEWEIVESDLDRFEQPQRERSAGSAKRSPARVRFVSRLVDRMVAGDEAGSWDVIEDAMVGGASPQEIYSGLLCPALRTIGDRWESGKLGVGDEHRASSVSLRLIGRLGPLFRRRGRRTGTVVIGAPKGEQHSIPIAVVADLVRIEGFEVLDLGADTPPDAFAATARMASETTRLVAVMIGVTVADNMLWVPETISALRSAASGPGSAELLVLLGGAGLSTQDEALEAGATLYTGSTGAEAVQVLVAQTRLNAHA